MSEILSSIVPTAEMSAVVSFMSQNDDPLNASLRLDDRGNATHRTVELATTRKSRIVVVGDLMLDRYYDGSVDRVSPEAPVPVRCMFADRLNIQAGPRTSQPILRPWKATSLSLV